MTLWRGVLATGSYLLLKNINIAANHNHPITNCRFDVYSYTTRVAVVNKNGNGDWETCHWEDYQHVAGQYAP